MIELIIGGAIIGGLLKAAHDYGINEKNKEQEKERQRQREQQRKNEQWQYYQRNSVDDRLKGAKLFQEFIQTSIAISENGYICINPLRDNTKLFNIKDVIEYDFEIIKNTGEKGALKGGLAGLGLGILFGGGGGFDRRFPWAELVGGAVGGLLGYSNAIKQIEKINLVFKINNFNNPFISVPLLTDVKNIPSESYEIMYKEIEEIRNTLEYLWNNKWR